MTSVKKRKLLIKQAIEAGDLGQLIFLLENEEKIWKSMARKRRDEALMHALVVGDESIFKYLLSHGAVVDMHLIDFLPGDSVELLLDSGWDINTIMPSSGHTVLWVFIQSEDIVQGLLDHGADLQADSYAKSHLPTYSQVPVDPSDIIERAAYLATPAIMDLLIAHGARVENSVPFHAIAELGSLDDGPGRLHAMIEHLQALGMDINDAHQFYPDDDRMTPLDTAIYDDNIEMVKFLLEHGANPMTGGLSSDLAREVLGPNAALVEMLEVFEQSCQHDPEAMRELFGTEGLPDQPQPIANSEHD